MTEARQAGQHVALDPEGVGRDLTCLVLTVVELVRELMERQALRRIDEGDLTEEQIEAVGVTLMALEDRMDELRDHFGLAPEDLNIDLGPLGPLLAPEPSDASTASTAATASPDASTGHGLGGSGQTPDEALGPYRSNPPRRTL